MPVTIRASGVCVPQYQPPGYVEIDGDRIPYRPSNLAQAAERYGADAIRRVIDAQEIASVESRLGHAAADYVETALGLLDAADLCVTRIRAKRVCWEVSGSTSLQFHTNLEGGDARNGSLHDAVDDASDGRQIPLFGRVSGRIS
ncbi:hypothetical protein GALL_494030 [mine drainage metagenome]|uniref:Uncharacterized protein n=1 Tax=mine drainage metagenome TaxID=410659 RepID=A0A1J5PML0_9ZZZZ